jgi:uncharacterized MAPEG superfamily protein
MERLAEGGASRMTIAEWTVFGAVLLYLLTVAPVKALGHRTFDNANPRDPAFYKPGMPARALGAHINGIETFPFFAAGVLLAEFRSQPQMWINLLAAGFLVVRLAYVLAYLGNWPTTRTLLWNVGFAFNTAIFLMPWWGPRI